jgi:hypothetical protein
MASECSKNGRTAKGFCPTVIAGVVQLERKRAMKLLWLLLGSILIACLAYPEEPPEAPDTIMSKCVEEKLPDSLISSRVISAKFLSFSVGDYYHASFQVDSVCEDYWVARQSRYLRYFLAAHRLKSLQIRVDSVRMYFHEIESNMVIETVTSAGLDSLDYLAWWKTEQGRFEHAYLAVERYDSLVDSLTE